MLARYEWADMHPAMGDDADIPVTDRHLEMARISFSVFAAHMRDAEIAAIEEKWSTAGIKA